VQRAFVMVEHQQARCQNGCCVKMASTPRKLFPGARYSIDFGLEVAIQKYLYPKSTGVRLVTMKRHFSNERICATRCRDPSLTRSHFHRLNAALPSWPLSCPSRLTHCGGPWSATDLYACTRDRNDTTEATGGKWFCQQLYQLRERYEMREGRYPPAWRYPERSRRAWIGTVLHPYAVNHSYPSAKRRRTRCKLSPPTANVSNGIFRSGP